MENLIYFRVDINWDLYSIKHLITKDATEEEIVGVAKQFYRNICKLLELEKITI